MSDDQRGFTIDTALEVNSISDEYAILESRKIRIREQRLVEHEGYFYDVFTGRDANDHSVTYYFKLLNGLETVESLFGKK